VQLAQVTGPQLTSTERVRVVLDQLMDRKRTIDGEVTKEDGDGCPLPPRDQGYASIAERHPFVTESMKPINWVLALARKTAAFSSDPV
jgi:hypothetical protein